MHCLIQSPSQHIPSRAAKSQNGQSKDLIKAAVGSTLLGYQDPIDPPFAFLLRRSHNQPQFFSQRTRYRPPRSVTVMPMSGLCRCRALSRCFWWGSLWWCRHNQRASRKARSLIATPEHAFEVPKHMPSAQSAGTKQAMLIAMLQAPEGAAITEIVAATGWLAHYADVRIMPM